MWTRVNRSVPMQSLGLTRARADARELSFDSVRERERPEREPPPPPLSSLPPSELTRLPLVSQHHHHHNNTQATHVLFESASGYALFDVRALDEIGTSADKVQESIR
jgi:hypothetical protein